MLHARGLRHPGDLPAHQCHHHREQESHPAGEASGTVTACEPICSSAEPGGDSSQPKDFHSWCSQTLEGNWQTAEWVREAVPIQLPSGGLPPLAVPRRSIQCPAARPGSTQDLNGNAKNSPFPNTTKLRVNIGMVNMFYNGHYCF